MRGKEGMESFERMLHRALRKMGGAAGPSADRAARSVLASQKGRATLFKGHGRPGLSHLAEEFGLGWPGGSLGSLAPTLLSEADQGRLAEGLAPWRERLARLHPAWHAFGFMAYPSCHDAHIARWESGSDGLLLEVDGCFSGGGDASLDRLAIFFEEPQSRALWRGVAVSTPGRGSWDRAAEPGKPFFQRALRGRGSLSMGALPWIQMEELSLAAEGRPAIRLCLGAGREVELEVSGAHVELAWGLGSMRAMSERRALEAEAGVRNKERGLRI